mgnify:CR=1 FL=1
MKNNKKKSQTISEPEAIHLPELGRIVIRAGAVPSSGATVSVEKLASEFRDAARQGTIPLPSSENLFKPAV